MVLGQPCLYRVLILTHMHKNTHTHRNRGPLVSLPVLEVPGWPICREESGGSNRSLYHQAMLATKEASAEGPRSQTKQPLVGSHQNTALPISLLKPTVENKTTITTINKRLKPNPVHATTNQHTKIQKHPPIGYVPNSKPSKMRVLPFGCPLKQGEQQLPTPKPFRNPSPEPRSLSGQRPRSFQLKERDTHPRKRSKGKRR